MAAPFCTACGADIAAGTRFCVKCGQSVGAAPPPAAPSYQVPPPAAPSYQAPLPPPPPALAFTPAAQVPPPTVQPVKEGSGAAVWIGIFGILLLLGGAGLWFYTSRARAAATEQVAAAPAPAPVAAPVPPVNPPSPEVPPPNPDFAQKPEEPPPNPDFAKKDEPAPAAKQQAAPPKPAAAPAPKPAVKASNPTSGSLHASVEVAQNGEVVFENLPGARLRFTFDHDAWKPTISHQPNGTQTLVMRSLKPGIQRTCDVRWEIVQP